jgi:hypothetical protein
MINKELEEAAGNYANKELNKEFTSKVGNFYGFSSSFIEGAKWQAERMISKEAYEDSLSMQRTSNAGYESKILELKKEIIMWQLAVERQEQRCIVLRKIINSKIEVNYDK